MVYATREGETPPLRWGFVKDRTEPPEPKERKRPETSAGPPPPAAPPPPSPAARDSASS